MPDAHDGLDVTPADLTGGADRTELDDIVGELSGDPPRREPARRDAADPARDPAREPARRDPAQEPVDDRDPFAEEEADPDAATDPDADPDADADVDDADPDADPNADPHAGDPRDRRIAALESAIAASNANLNRLITALQAGRDPATAVDTPLAAPAGLNEREVSLRQALITKVLPEVGEYIRNRERILATVETVPTLQRENEDYWNIQRDRTVSRVLDGVARLRLGDDKASAAKLSADDRGMIDAAFRSWVGAVDERTGRPVHPQRVARYMHGDPTLVEEFVQRYEGRRTARETRERNADTVRRFDRGQQVPRAVPSAATAARGPRPAPKDETLDSVIDDAWKTISQPPARTGTRR